MDSGEFEHTRFIVLTHGGDMDFTIDVRKEISREQTAGLYI